MGVLDKLKNALFEVEYVEVDEPPRKEKKVKKEKREKKEEKPIAKKIVLPGTRTEKVEELQEEELKDEDFEIRPKEEQFKEKSHEDFKIMDDSDFKVDDDFQEQPEILRDFEEEKPVFEEQNRVARRSDSFERQKEYFQEEKKEEYYQEEVINDTYSNSNKESTFSQYESKLYGRDNSYNVPVHEYGTYEKKEEKIYFKPSPIISPIYGILDKNYKKEDVKEKKEVRITSNYTRSNVSVDDIRNKAYGKKNLQEQEVSNNSFDDGTKFEVEEEDNLLVDLSDHKKPEVKELTVGDALEYFQDLGLEYNVDYVDVSKEKPTQKHGKSIDNENPLEKDIMSMDKEKSNVSNRKKTIEVKDEASQSKDVSSNDDNDNLFDLIDSMYQEND